MEYKVLKKFYDPFKQRRIVAGETIEIPEKHLEGYLPYIQGIETATPEIVEIKKIPTIEEAKAAPPMQIIERKTTKKKVK